MNTEVSSCGRNLVLTDLLAFAIDFWMLLRYIPEHFGDSSQDTRLGQYSYLAHDRLLKFIALICGFI